METMISASVSSAGLPGQLVAMGGPVMVVLMVLAVIGMVAFFYLMLYGALLAPHYSGRLKQAVRQWQQRPDQSIPDRLRTDCRGLNRLNPLRHLVLATMERRLRQEPAEQIQEVLSQKAQQALIPFEAPLKIIEVIAALAPLLGLLGTVIGMMEAFSTMAAAQGQASASQLSGGIYQALTTTAAGLIVAIPFAAIAAWVEFRLRRLQNTLNTVLFETLNPSPQANDPGPVNRQPVSQPTPPVSDFDWQGHQALNAIR